MTQPTPDRVPRRGRAPVSLNVATGDDAARLSAPVDWAAWYLTDEEDMGQSPDHDEVVKILGQSVDALLESREDTSRYAGTDQFFGWRADHPLVRVSPDVFVLPYVPQRPYPASWQTWREGHQPPQVAFEVVSQDWKKDYEDNPAKYAQLGVEELVIFDPMLRGGRESPLQIFRWSEDGVFVQDACGDGPLHCRSLDIWLVSEDVVGGRILRLAHDAAGVDRVPTRSEERAAAREAEQAARKDAERERVAREAAEEELARLRAMLAEQTTDQG